MSPSFFFLAQAEDKGVDRVAVYSSAGNRVAQTTGLDTLLREDFDIVVNDFKHRVHIPEESEWLRVHVNTVDAEIFVVI